MRILVSGKHIGRLVPGHNKYHFKADEDLAGWLATHSGVAYEKHPLPDPDFQDPQGQHQHMHQEAFSTRGKSMESFQEQSRGKMAWVNMVLTGLGFGTVTSLEDTGPVTLVE